MKSAVSRPVQSTGPRAASTVNLLPPLSVTTVGCSVCSVTTFMPLWTSNHSDCVTAAALPPHTAYLLVCWFLQWKDWLTSCWTLLTRDIISSGPGVGQTQIFDDAAAATTTTWHHCVVFSVVFVYYNYYIYSETCMSPSGVHSFPAAAGPSAFRPRQLRYDVHELKLVKDRKTKIILVPEAVTHLERYLTDVNLRGQS